MWLGSHVAAHKISLTLDVALEPALSLFPLLLALLAAILDLSVTTTPILFKNYIIVDEKVFSVLKIIIVILLFGAS